jgi:hypothetical protein
MPVSMPENRPRFKQSAYGSIGAILLSGIYNFLREDGALTHYQMWSDVKALLASHMCTAVILCRGKRKALPQAVISAFTIVAIAGFPRVLPWP